MSTTIDELDGVRGVAVLSVMGLHTFGFGAGWVGVQVFFVLSGFLITRGLLERRALGFGAYLRGFYLRRAARILPLYAAWLLVVALVFAWRHEPPWFTTELPYLATFTVNFTRARAGWGWHPLTTHLWSLSVEEQFYLLWPFVVWRLEPRRLAKLALVVMVLAPLARVAYGAWLDDGTRDAYAVGDAVYWATFSQVDAFAMGGAVAAVLHLSPGTRLFSRALGPLAALAVGAGALVLAFPSLAGLERVEWSTFGYPLALRATAGQHAWGYTVLDLAAAALIGMLAGPAAPAWRPVRWLFALPWLRALGRVSYGMYVVHWGIAWLIWQTSTFPPWAFGGYVLAVWLVAAASHRWFEAPILRAAHRVR